MPQSTREVMAQRLAMAEAPPESDAGEAWQYFGDSYKHLVAKGRITFADEENQP